VTAVAVNIIMIAVTILMAGFVGVWLIVPRSRGWIEAPKYQPLRWDVDSAPAHERPNGT
jgi:hypothetical protein